MIIHYSADQCGAGKTTKALDAFAEQPGRYVLVVDRKLIASSRKREIEDRLARLNRVAPVICIVDDDVDRPIAQTVGRRIADAGRDYGPNPHVILIITHAGMMRCPDWSGFDGWDGIVIDELPQILDREEHHLSRWLKPTLVAFYDLVPTDLPGVSEITFRGGVSSREVAHQWQAFHQRVISGGARYDLETWDDIDDLERREWQSWRQWEFGNLSPFRRVTMLADSFDESDTFALISRSEPQVTFQAFTVAANRQWARREVVVRYVSDDVRAATSRFRSDAFAPDMAKVSGWLADVGTDQHIWTTNTNLKISGSIRGRRVTPKQAGTNEFMTWNHASAIYAAKPSRLERQFYAAHGIEAEVVIRSREAYDLNQLFLRTSLRLPASTAPVELRCFDRLQAETFAAKLERQYGLTPTLIFDDIGLEVRQAKPGRPRLAVAKTAEQVREAARLRKQKQRANAVAKAA